MARAKKAEAKKVVEKVKEAVSPSSAETFSIHTKKRETQASGTRGWTVTPLVSFDIDMKDLNEAQKKTVREALKGL
jgi:hypothetical protein